MARRKTRKRRVGTRRRRRRNNILAVNRPRRRRASVRRSVRRRRRRSNPPFTTTGILNTLTRGVMDAGLVVGGEMAANVIGNQIPVFLKEPQQTEAGTVEVESKAGALLRQGIAALAVGFVASIIFRGRSDVVRTMVAGALSAPVRGFVKPLLPTTGPLRNALSGGRMLRFASYPRTGVSSYPGTQYGLGSYPRTPFALSDGGATADPNPYGSGIVY